MTDAKLLDILQTRFTSNKNRHEQIEWTKVEERIKANPEKIEALKEMERTGGEPDVLLQDLGTSEFIFFDCSPESPSGRRNTCYDGKGQEERNKKGIFPEGNAVDMALAMGIELLTEEQYRQLQQFGRFDNKTSSWIKTPASIRKLGGAMFADYRYDHIFIYHNSAPSFYSSRGFRGCLRV